MLKEMVLEVGTFLSVPESVPLEFRVKPNFLRCEGLFVVNVKVPALPKLAI